MTYDIWLQLSAGIFSANDGPIFVKYSLNLWAIDDLSVILWPFTLIGLQSIISDFWLEFSIPLIVLQTSDKLFLCLSNCSL